MIGWKPSGLPQHHRRELASDVPLLRRRVRDPGALAPGMSGYSDEKYPVFRGGGGGTPSLSPGVSTKGCSGVLPRSHIRVTPVCRSHNNNNNNNDIITS